MKLEGGQDRTSDSACGRGTGAGILRVALGPAVAFLLAAGNPASGQWFYQSPRPQAGTLQDVAFVDGADIGMAVQARSVFRTEDGGVTWWFPGGPWGVDDVHQVQPDLNAVSLVDEHTATVVGFTGGFAFNAYVARTTDGGVTWTPQISGTDMPGTALLDVSFNGPTSGVAVGARPVTDCAPVILTTADGGTTWTPASLTDVPAQAALYGVSFSGADTGIAVGSESCLIDPNSGVRGLILRTTDGGQTWFPGLQGPDDIEFSAATFTGSNWIAVGSHGTIFTSTDGGESWVERDSGTDQFLGDVTCLDALNCIAAGGGTANVPGTTQGRVVLRTTDGGETWTTLVMEEEGSSLLAAASYDAAGLVLVGYWEGDGAGGVILRSTDGGGSWHQVSGTATGAPLRSVSFTDVATGTAVGNQGTILRTTDGGSSWDLQASGTTLPLLGVSFVDEAHGVAVGGTGGGPLSAPTHGVIVRTADGGATWSSRTLENEHGHQLALVDVVCTDVSHCTAVGRVGADPDGFWAVIMRTEDGGDNWVVQYLEPSAGEGFHGVHCIDPLSCIAVGRDSGPANSFVARTVDGGETWSRTAIEGSVLEAVSLIGDQTGTAVGWRSGGTGVVLRTIDGGATWTTAMETDYSLRDVSFAGDSGVVAGWNGTLLRTSDGGELWTRDVDDIPPQAGYTDFWGVASPQEGHATVVGDDAGQGQILSTTGEPTFPVVLTPDGIAACAPEEGSTEAVDILVGLGSAGGYEGTVTLSTSGEPPGVVSDLAPSVVDVPSNAATWTMTVDASVPAGHHTVTLTADDGVQQTTAAFRLGVVDPEEAPGLVLPLDGVTGVAVQPAFTWQPIPGAGAYRIQVATDGAFDEIVIDAEVTETGFTPSDGLTSDTQYFWRVRGVMPGTQGCSLAWSTVFSFTTEPRPVAEVTPEGIELEVAVGGGGNANLDVANVGTGDLFWELQTAQTAAVAGDRSAVGRAPADTAGRAGTTRDDDRAALDLASVLGAPLPGLRPIAPADGLVGCDDEPGLIVHDDGTIESGYTGNPEAVDQVAFVDRFTPNAYPATLTSVCVAFLSSGPTGLDFEIVILDDDDVSGGPGTELGALPASVDGIPTGPSLPPAPPWFRIDIASLGLSIDSGSVYIGVRWAPSDPGVFVASDESPERPVGFAGGYWWNDVIDTWAPTQSAFANYRSLLVRAVSIPGGCHDPSTVPWLSPTPDAGITPAGGTTPVQIAVDASGLAVGEYTASLCIASNDAENPIVAVPISLTVVGSVLTLDPQSLDFGDIFVDATSDPRAATLHNTGTLAATGLGFQATGGGFEVDAGTCGTTLGAGDSCPVDVTFAPIESGPAAGTLQVTSETGLPVVLGLAGNGVRETEVFTPMGLEVDTEPIVSDANGVFEPGELAPVAPVWRHDGVTPLDLTGTVSDLTGPEGPTYELPVADAVYGVVEPGALTGCQESASCYEMAVGPVGVVRPTLHWDAVFDEALSDDTSHMWTLHVGDSFADVPRESPFYGSVEALLHSGVTGGCAGAEYCPGGFSSRAQMPVFVLRALEGPGYQPPTCSVGAPTFADVPIDSPFCPWIKELVERGVVSGCGGDSYCPDAPVTRAQMAIFLLRTLEGAGYTPPDCAGEFTDVTCPSPFAAWVEELARRGVTRGCSATEFCPSAPVTRAQMATFIIRTFGLELYGP